MSKDKMVEQEAIAYVASLPFTDVFEKNVALEDFAAGFVRGQESSRETLAFIKEKLAHIEEIAAREEEFYSLSIARYVLKWIGERS